MKKKPMLLIAVALSSIFFYIQLDKIVQAQQKGELEEILMLLNKKASTIQTYESDYSISRIIHDGIIKADVRCLYKKGVGLKVILTTPKEDGGIEVGLMIVKDDEIINYDPLRETMAEVNLKKLRTMFEEGIKRLAENIASSHGGKAEVKYIRGYNALINTENEALNFIEAAKPVFGKENIRVLKNPSMGAEDFSYYVNLKKGAMAWLGAGFKDRYNYPIHHSKMEVDESALINGCYALINLVTRMGEENVFN